MLLSFKYQQLYIAVFVASLITGSILAAYQVHPLIWLGSYLLFWRATFVGRAVITLATAWAVICTWVGILRWSSPFHGLKPQMVAFYLLGAFCITLLMIYGVAWRSEKIQKIQEQSKLLSAIFAILISIGFGLGSVIWYWLKL
ncbi:MAG: hypothetical protein WCO45_06770 [Pseudanabaena sp. ELA607]|jgi:hypothetical protein